MSGQNFIHNLNLLHVLAKFSRMEISKKIFILDKFVHSSVESERTGAADSSLDPDDVVLVPQCSERLMPPTSLKCYQSGHLKMQITT